VKEVGCRALEPFLLAADQRRLPRSELARNVGHSLRDLENVRERIDWEAFRTFMTNVATHFSDDEIRHIGAVGLQVPSVKWFMMVGRTALSASGFYRWVISSGGPGSMMFSNVVPVFRELAPGKMEAELRMAPGYQSSREFFLYCAGGFQGLPFAMGLDTARVTMREIPNGVRFDITLPPERGVRARVARLLTRKQDHKVVAAELQNAMRDLEQRYDDLDAARTALAQHARQLTAANRIVSIALRAPSIEDALGRVCAALIEEADCERATLTLLDKRRATATSAAAPSAARTEFEFAICSGDTPLGTLAVVGAAAVRGSIEPLVPTIALVVQKALDQQALTEYRQSLEQRVADRTAELTRARDELAATVTRLEETKASRERLFHNISHEIRTPLSLVLLLVDGVLTHHGGELTGRAVAQMHAITISTRKLVRLVDELLLLASGEERDLQVTPEPIDLAAVLPELLAGWVLAAEDAGLTLTTICPPEAVVLADPVALERVLANLLSNAIKFTPRGGQVAVAVEAGPTTTRIAVRDSGIGIDDELRGRLFGRFEQGAGGKRLRAGSGIGLSIARELVRAHGGELDAAANRDGPGSTFAFTLATSSVELARQVAPGSLRPTDYGVGAGPSLGTVSPPGLSRGHILVAEDDPGLAAAIGQLLSDEYTVQLASDGAEALAAAQRRLPDLLITDIEMPQIDGLELARQLQSLPGETPTPVLVMSARAKLGDRLAGFSAGAVDYVIKPFDPSELRARVRAQLAYRTLALRLQRSEKLAALGTLSAGLAHELRNPANGIVNAIAPLRELLPAEALAPDTGVGELLDVMQQCAEQVAYVSRQLLGFRRSGDLELRRVPIGEVLTRALSNASAALAEVELRTRYAYQGLLRCAAPLLTQVLVNLIENAAQAAGPGGWVELATRGDDQVVAIELTDSGPGVPEHLTERVFEPFFTTKPPGQGTGLGLATARDLILRHGGTLELRSRSGRTVFVIELPQAPEVRP
jgi:signal transduction histidine kinase